MNYDAILFDLDGTLIDSIDLWGQAVIDMFKGEGVTVSEEQFRNTYAPALPLPAWLKKFNVPETRADALRGERDRHYVRLLEGGVRWFPGAVETLRTLSAKLPLGLVTGSWKIYVDAVDRRLSVKRHFKTIVTADEFGGFDKTHPHPYLLAADRLGVDPKRCLYVGDTLADVEGSHAAGMQCCIYPGRFTADKAKKQADFVVDSLEKLPAIIGM
jgi:HAD superfamily hydrolase (TIGR01509 family)